MIKRIATHDAPISATAMPKSPRNLFVWGSPITPTRKTVSLLAISLSHLEQHWKLQLKLPLGLE
jgi:DNA polymerase IV